jgi:septum formation protein
VALVTVLRPYRLILASASPARRALLAAAGVAAEVMVSGVDESTATATTPQAICLELATLKARAVAERLPADGVDGRRTLVLGCDSMLEFDGEILGKPVDAADAAKRLRSMRGRSGVLHTGHHLLEPAGGAAEAVASTVVRFADVSDDEIDAYVATGEPLHVAGAFTIDGRGAVFVEAIEGDHSNVIGLSMPLLRRLLGQLGVPVTGLWV